MKTLYICVTGIVTMAILWATDHDGPINDYDPNDLRGTPWHFEDFRQHDDESYIEKENERQVKNDEDDEAVEYRWLRS